MASANDSAPLPHDGTPGVRRLTLLLTFLLGLVATPDLRAQDCLECHAKREKLVEALGGKIRPIEPLLIDEALRQRSLHKDSCDSCHMGYEEFPHPAGDAESIGCADCHDDAKTKHEAGIHGRKGANDRLHATCADCHGAHDVLRPTTRDSRLHPLNVHLTCGKCHFEHPPETLSRTELLREKYVGDSHGHGIVKAGLVVSATCVSCHGSHAIRPAGDPESLVARGNIAEMCGTCHLRPLEEYRESIHALTNANGDGEVRGATCTDCHPPHHIQGADAGFRLATVTTCGTCHADRAGTYESTYHGKVALLGDGSRVATCAHCHGNHDIRPSTDEASLTHPVNLVNTCGQCHAGSHENFVTYSVHADPQDAENYPALYVVHHAMQWLLIVVFSLGGLHAVLWFVRSMLAKEYRRPAQRSGKFVRRWRQFYVYLHVTFMLSFLFLAGTGLPLHYSDERWALRLMNFFGGVPAAGYVHRVAAIVMIGCVTAYCVHIAHRFVVQREKGLFSGPNTMLPRMQDLRDLAGNLRWFLGLGPKPRFDRWTYWEKFDFWAVFWGMVIIGGSGILMWFPETATLLIPGWVVNIAVIVHGHEALLAVGFIFTIHIFHANLRPDKLPMDTLFYTGRLTEEEFLHERGIEADRAREGGHYEELLDAPPRRRTRARAYLLGSIAMMIGVTFTVLMVLAALG